MPHSHIASAPLSDQTIDALAKGLFNEAKAYGFEKGDYIRFVNRLLALSMNETAGCKADGHVPCFSKNITPKLPIKAANLNLRRLDPLQDRGHLKRWLSDPEGQWFMLSRSNAHLMSLEELIEDPHHHLGVITLPDHTPIGCVAYIHHDKKQQKAELRKLIGEPSMRGKGFAKGATSCWIQYGFQALDLQKIYINTLRTNIRNVRLNKELGFSVEGLLRNEIFFKDAYFDVLRMAIWRNKPLEEKHIPPISSS